MDSQQQLSVQRRKTGARSRKPVKFGRTWDELRFMISSAWGGQHATREWYEPRGACTHGVRINFRKPKARIAGPQSFTGSWVILRE